MDVLLQIIGPMRILCPRDSQVIESSDPRVPLPIPVFTLAPCLINRMIILLRVENIMNLRIRLPLRKKRIIGDAPCPVREGVGHAFLVKVLYEGV